MGITVDGSFQELTRNLEIVGPQTSTVSALQNEICDAVAKHMGVLDSFLAGSYSRSTMIAPLSKATIDVFVVLDPRYCKTGGQAHLLDEMAEVLLGTCAAKQTTSWNGRAVAVVLDDFTVNVIPAFCRQGGGYLIPGSVREGWIETDPKVHVEAMVDANTSHGGDLVPLVKMIKCWNRNIGNAFVPFYLEVLAINIFRDMSIPCYSIAMTYFFERGRDAIRYTLKDPAGYGQCIQGLRSCGTVDDAVTKFCAAYVQTSTAERKAGHTRLGSDAIPFPLGAPSESAIGDWQKVFGDYFPTYG